MQTLSEIRGILREEGLRPQKRFGQNFLIDKNLMGKLLELASVGPGGTVLEVGPGTGSLTEELADRAALVVAVEIDRGLFSILSDRLGGRANVRLILGDVLAGKHEISPAVAAALGGKASLVANLPYNTAAPLICQCLIDTWRANFGKAPPPGAARPCEFDRLTFTVQRELAERFTAGAGEESYGPVSVLISTTARAKPGPAAPAQAFWPRPNVDSRMVRIDFDRAAAAKISDIETLLGAVALAFSQRRKKIGSIVRRKNSPFAPERLSSAMARAGINPDLRPEDIPPGLYVALADALCESAEKK